MNQRLRRSPPDVVYTPIDVTSDKNEHLDKVEDQGDDGNEDKGNARGKGKDNGKDRSQDKDEEE